MRRVLMGTVAGLSLLAIACCFLRSAPAAAQEAAAAVTVEKMAFGTDVKDRELVGAAEEFPAGTPQVWCWTRLSAKSAPISVKHVWSLDGRKMLEVPLKLNYASGRTWSHKNVRPGAWKVEVVTDEGTVVGAATFSVK